MSNLNILIVEGNIKEDSEFFIKAAGASAADNLKNLILKIEPSANTEIINPGHDDEITNALKDMSKYNGIVFTGGAMRINDMTDVIKKHINFASNCFTQKKKILAICWITSLLNSSWWQSKPWKKWYSYWNCIRCNY